VIETKDILKNTTGRDCLIILAAGEGIRLRPYTLSVPKILLKIRDRTILEYHLNAATLARIKHVIVVTGYMSRLIEKFIRTLNNNELDIEIVVNHEYERTGNFFSLFMALNRLELNSLDTLYFINGDVVFDPPILLSMKMSQYPDLVATDTDPIYYQLENPAKVKIGTKGSVIQLSRTIPLQEAAGVSMELFKLSSTSSIALRDRGKEILLEDKKQEWGKPLNTILSSGEYSPLAHDISKWNWWEIDTLDDYRLAKVIFAKHSNLSKFTSKGLYTAPEYWRLQE
jgi:choline kinase